MHDAILSITQNYAMVRIKKTLSGDTKVFTAIRDIGEKPK